MSRELVVPPEELLTPPAETQIPEGSWTVVARNRRVNRDWEELVDKAPENAARCYHDLSVAPMRRQPGRVFPLKGKAYKGAWEYEVTAGDRLFYHPDPINRKVVVYYAGPHVRRVPTPPG
jgi:hypothetical protein